MKKNSNLELRNEEVQEILSRPPHWMIRWGNVVVLIIVGLIFIFSYLIKYPEIIHTRAIITTPTPPEKLFARNSGRIKKIFVKNKDTTKAGELLAIIENTANYRDVILLKKIIDSIGNIYYQNQFYFPFEEISMLQLGNIQDSYILFEKAYLDYDLNRNLKPLLVEKTYQSQEENFLKKRLILLKQQKEIEQNELTFKKNELKRYSKLHKNGIISDQEWESKQIEISNANKNFKNLLVEIIQLESSVNGLNKNMKNTVIEKNTNNLTLLRNVLQSYNELKTAIANWELLYALRPSIDGQVSFTDVWSENQSVKSGELVFTIIPTDVENYLGKAKAPAQNSGKIKVGQKVKIHLDNYPDNEYGTILGKLKSISLAPDSEGNLLLDIALPYGLKTSYDKKIDFYPEMTGTADIVTEDLRLSERILYQFRDIFKR